MSDVVGVLLLELIQTHDLGEHRLLKQTMVCSPGWSNQGRARTSTEEDDPLLLYDNGVLLMYAGAFGASLGLASFVYY